MNKEKPETFDDGMEINFTWFSASCGSDDWTHVEPLGIYGDYYLYWAWMSDKQNGSLYRTKIEKEPKICEKCGRKLE